MKEEMNQSVAALVSLSVSSDFLERRTPGDEVLSSLRLVGSDTGHPRLLVPILISEISLVSDLFENGRPLLFTEGEILRLRRL